MGYDLQRLRAGIPPLRLRWFTRLRSTNDHAIALRRKRLLFAPALVLTGNQIAGRGRGGNKWWSAAGCITATFVLGADERAPHEVPLVAGLALRDAVAELCDTEDIGLKWPNDLVHNGRKLAGLLCERIEGVDLIGVGLNVNPDLRQAPTGLRAAITSIQEICGDSEISTTDALITASRHLHAALSRRGNQLFGQTLQRYDAYHVLVGRRIAVSSDGNGGAIHGLCEGLDPTGKLLLRDRANRLHHIIAGQVQLDTPRRK